MGDLRISGPWPQAATALLTAAVLWQPAGSAMLPLLLLLAGLGQLTSASQNYEDPLLQITVPQKIPTNRRDDAIPAMHVTYLINIKGKAYTIHLEKQSFLPPDLMMYSYNSSGALLVESPFTKVHCFYQGYAAEISHSVVTLNICSGLRGLLQLENVSYGIEPLKATSTYEHILYEIGNKKMDFSPLQRNYTTKQIGDNFYRILVKSKNNSDDIQVRRNLRLQIILDKALYDYMGSNVAIAAEKVVQIFGLINTVSIYIQIKVFLLSVYRDHPNYVGATYHGVACSPNLAVGIALYPKMTTLEEFSVVMTQLLAVNLGLTYDDIYKCYCSGNTCIMNPEAIHSRGVKFFSSCSLDEFKNIVGGPEFVCLQNQIASKVAIQGRQDHAVCGNGILEGQEQCDCGKPQTCKFSKCCQAETCTLIGFAECGSGICCEEKSCLVSEHGKVCRKSHDPCDFTEYCTGTSEFCVPDMKSADLEPCDNYTAFCFEGRCQSMDRQCIDLFGKFAKGADYLCIQELNSNVDDFGSCQGKACGYRSILCGKIVCHWTATGLVPLADHDIQYTYLRGHVCISAYLRNLTLRTTHDDTFVQTGTICGSNGYCEASVCRSVNAYSKKVNCSSLKKCNGHGVCNQNLNCQCDVGYAPPFCDPAPASFGGSIDDGFWRVTDLNTALFVKQRAAPQHKGLLISLYVFLPFLVLTAIIILKWNTVKGLWNRGKAVSGGSVLEDSNSNSSLTESSY
ncbi:A disintegrin and metallopeptidase domain 3 [Echinops telfairi]|uniref:A disintegrin and metallopeptidase domain 3 n=1 Tax=Echinops telfairi TaxID=9371 RepID=A0AC55CTG8_ECHTE|nr:A disintegrin and metallopeptidase domain 3 [Echinops telfairi]